MTNKTELGEVYPLQPNEEWKKCSGALPIKMTNDYLFRALMQSDNETLKVLIADLLYMDVSDVSSAVVQNPIMLGRSITDKYYILDVKVLLNGKTNLDLEMQVVKEVGWQERSLGYLCRTYDRFNRGDNYFDAKPAIQVAFLDFTLFSDLPEFYSTYRLMNVKNHNVYTDKFRLSAVDLGNINLATEEDKRHHIDLWARMFKAQTWEDLKMVAHENEAISKAISGVYQLTEEERIMEQCQQREDFMNRQAAEKRYIEKQNAQIKELKRQLEEKDKQDAQIKELNAQIEDLKRQIMELSRK